MGVGVGKAVSGMDRMEGWAVFVVVLVSALVLRLRRWAGVNDLT